MTMHPIPHCEAPCKCKLTVEVLYFYRAVHAHRSRLFGLYDLIRQEIPEMFGPWKEETQLIQSYLYLHDLPKIQSLDKLKEHGYKSQHTLCCRLGQFYGKNKAEMTLMEQNYLEAAILDLNSIEDKQKKKLVDSLSSQWTEAERKDFDKFISWLERVVDVTDTELWRGEEMGRTPVLFGATQYLERRGEKNAAELSFQLESMLQNNAHLTGKFTIH